MGLIRAAVNAAGGVLSDQWKDYFYCDALEDDVLVLKGQKRTLEKGNKGTDNIISNGSVVAVANGQCMIIVEQGKVVDICSEPGEFIYDTSTEPSLFTGGLSENIGAVFKNIGKRFTFGGVAPKDQRVYYVNTKELMGNKYGTPSPISFNFADKNINLYMDIQIKCSGEYSYRITNPILFYTNVTGNVADEYTRNQIDSQMKAEMVDAFAEAVAVVSMDGMRLSELRVHNKDICAALNDSLSSKWRDLRGIEMVSFALMNASPTDEYAEKISRLQSSAAFTDPRYAMGYMAQSQSDAMMAAASNEAGAMAGFMGMNMVGQATNGSFNTMAGMAQQQMQQMQQAGGMGAQAPQAQQPQQPQQPQAAGWTCACGQAGNTGNFCAECGQPKPAPAADGWTCSCGHVNKGKFCAECGQPKPAGTPQYKCDKCGWEPEDPAHPPKFCPECGDPFDDGDLK